MNKIRIRVPKLNEWHLHKNRAKYNQLDQRFNNFILRSNQFHVYPDYFEEGNPNTGDDLALIEFNQKNIITTIKNDCKFWTLGSKRFIYDKARHMGNTTILKVEIFVVA